MILNKLLPLFLSPLFLLTAFAVFAIWLRRRRLAILALASLWLFSLPVVADSLWRVIEQQALRPAVSAAPQAQAIVVLGGMTWDILGEQGFERVRRCFRLVFRSGGGISRDPEFIGHARAKGSVGHE